MKKFIYPILCLISAIYSVCYAGIGGFRGNAGALSKIGLSHPFLFAVWGITTYAVLSFGIIQGYRKTKYKFYIWLLAVSFTGILLTVSCDFDYDERVQYVLHCLGSLTFSAVMGITVLLLFLLSKSYILAAISGVVLIADLVLLLIFKETAIIELMPIFTGYILMSIYNFKKEKILIGTHG